MQSFDLHMHTTYCDGNNSAEEMILAAASLGLDTVGLSGHSFTWFDPSYCMSPEGTEAYIAEVRSLREKYRGRVKVLLGTELDYFAEIDTAPYDYLIGSSHYILKDGAYIDVDYTPEIFLDGVQKYFGGDVMAAVCAYYAQVGDMVRKTRCDIIGHFDLVTKFVERRPMFDTQAPEYIAAWKKAVDQIFEDTAELRASGCPNRLFDEGGPLHGTAGFFSASACSSGTPGAVPGAPQGTCGRPVFEINTGAMSKGYRTAPYPAADQIEYIRSRGGLLILNSDSHAVTTVAHAFAELDHLV